MKIAIAHDRLEEFGGAERFLQSLLRLYPDAHVYTAYIDKTFVRILFPTISQDRLHTSFIQRLKLSRWGYLLQPLAPIIWRSFNFENYDAVISSSSYFLANTIRVKKPIHIQYIHSLPKNIFNLSSKTPIQKVIHYERFVGREYKRALMNSSTLVANSKHTQKMLKQMFGVSSVVIYPPVSRPSKPPKHNRGSYYLTVSRLDDTKEIELVIQACNLLRVPLKIVGIGNDPQYVNYLHTIAGPTVEFLGFRSDGEIQRLYIDAIAFLFSPRAEDFGLAPVEAMAHGVPVVAYHGGGAKETVIPGKTGEFFYEYTKEVLMRAIRTFDPSRYSPKVMHATALQYSEERFQKEMEAYISAALRRSDRVFDKNLQPEIYRK